MANKKFSEFVLKTDTSDVSHIVGYNGAENVQITPANFVTGGGTGVFLPLAGGTMVGNTIHNDNVKSIWGRTGNDLEIFHDGNNSYIKDVGTGDLNITSDGTGVNLQKNTSEYLARFLTDAAVELYHDNIRKFQTTSTGISVTGNATVGTGVINESIGGDIAITQGAVGIRINDSASAITPTTAAANNDNVVDLGTSNIRFKDLHLGGNGNFGGNIEIDSTLPTIIMTDTDTSGFARIRASNGGLLLESDENNTQADSTTRFEIDGSEKMRLDASGNLGVGTSTPSQKLEIAGNIRAFETAASSGAYIDVVSGGTWRFKSNPISGTNPYGLDIIKGSGGTDIKMSIDQSGNVGIGTAISTAKLSVVDNSLGDKLLLAGDDASALRGLLFNCSTTTNVGDTWDIQARSASGIIKFSNNSTERLRIDSNGALTVGSQGSTVLTTTITENDKVDLNAGDGTGAATGRNLTFSTGNSERMRLTSAGNLGINTTTAKAVLDINGDINTTGNNADTLEFSTFFSSGTTTIATLSNELESTTAVASIEYVGLFGFGGSNMVAGILMASTRYNNATTWTSSDDITISVSGTNTGLEPTLFWDNGVLKLTVPGSVQLTSRIRITYHDATLTRNHPA